MSFRKLHALVIEDEKIAREGLIRELNKTVEFEVKGWAESVLSGFDLVEKTPAEALFLDIELIGGTAFELLNLLKRQGITIPPVIIVTGFEKYEYARSILNDFQAEVIYILNKPFWKNWESEQEKIVNTIYVRNQEERRARFNPVSARFVSVPDGNRTYSVNPDDIVMVHTGEKGKGKTELVFLNQRMQCNLSLAQILTKLPPDIFQINRFEAVNLAWISMIDHGNREVLLRNGQSLCVGQSFYAMLCQRLET